MSWESDYGDLIGIPYVDTSYDTPRTADSVVTDIVTQRQDVGTSSNDQWTGFFQKAAGALVDYGIKRDAAMTGVKLQAANRPAVPMYTAGVAAGPSGLTISPVMLIIGGLVAVLVLKK
ncbi:MAG: hypothetical protein ABIR56_04145 [Polaromonas sp.]